MKPYPGAPEWGEVVWCIQDWGDVVEDTGRIENTTWDVGPVTWHGHWYCPRCSRPGSKVYHRERCPKQKCYCGRPREHEVHSEGDKFLHVFVDPAEPVYRYCDRCSSPGIAHHHVLECPKERRQIDWKAWP